MVGEKQDGDEESLSQYYSQRDDDEEKSLSQYYSQQDEMSLSTSFMYSSPEDDDMSVSISQSYPGTVESYSYGMSESYTVEFPEDVAVVELGEQVA